MRSGATRTAWGWFSILSVGLLLPTGFSVLSFAPIAVFETANGVSRERFYDIHLVSETGKRIANSLGRTTDTELMGERSYDTLLLGAATEIVPPTARTVAFLRDAVASTSPPFPKFESYQAASSSL